MVIVRGMRAYLPLERRWVRVYLGPTALNPYVVGTVAGPADGGAAARARTAVVEALRAMRQGAAE